MPPSGGFEMIKYKRSLPLKGPSGLIMLLGVVGITGYGFYRVGLGNRERRFVQLLASNSVFIIMNSLENCRERRLGPEYTLHRC
jgi:hypothetical protein